MSTEIKPLDSGHRTETTKGAWEQAKVVEEKDHVESYGKI